MKTNNQIAGKCGICKKDGHNARTCDTKKVNKPKKVTKTKKNVKKIDWKKVDLNPIKWIKENKMTPKKIESMLKLADKAYHNGESLIEDVTYDTIVSYLEDLTGMKRKAIGAPVEKGATRVKLPIHMGSMDKVKPDTNKLKNWLKKYNGPYVISDKLDGISIMVHYKPENPVPSIYTRGNGKVGSDASDLVNWMEFPKITSPNDVFFRGELLISKSNWSIFEKTYKNPRNAVSGLIGGLVSGKKIRGKFLKLLHFLVFDVVTKELMNSSDQLAYAKSVGFMTVHHTLYPDVTIKNLSDILISRRTESDYEIDGIIVMDNKVYPRPKSGNPKYAVAFKMVLEDQKAESTVQNVVWNVSKHGTLKPIVIINPVNIGGSKVQRVTGYNAKWIIDNNIGPGANVILIKSGDIIPKIIKVTKKPTHGVSMPEGKLGVDWEWAPGNVEARIKGHNDDAEIQKILFFTTRLDIEGFKLGTIKKVYAAGFKTIPKILAMTIDDFLAIDGIQNKMAQKLYNGMRQRWVSATNIELLAAMNAFGQGISQKKIEPLLAAIPNLCDKDFKMSDAELTSKIIAIEGFSNKSALKIIENLNNCQKMLAAMPEKPKIKIVKEPEVVELDITINRDVSKDVIIFSGFRDKQLTKVLISRGALFPTSLSKKVNLVVSKTPEKITGKVAKAQKLCIPVMSIETFYKFLATSS